MKVYILTEYLNQYDRDPQPVAVFADGGQALAAQRLQGNNAGDILVMGVVTLAEHEQRRIREEREADALHRDLAVAAAHQKEQQRLSDLAKLNSTPNTYPRPYRAPHKMSKAQVEASAPGFLASADDLSES